MSIIFYNIFDLFSGSTKKDVGSLLASRNLSLSALLSPYLSKSEGKHLHLLF
jgi:hypothetical protein